ncbi:MAG TPA: DUF4921 family protein [Acidimicrobiia bacterium]|nr:DUF4921 family protein [Acidimicrobiia bacterium]
MSELRTDPLTGTLVIVAPGRAARPDTFTAHEERADAIAACPFCPGHERETPPETFRTGSGAADEPGWTIRVFPNKFPIVTRTGAGIRGIHEVLVLSPDHRASFAELTPGDAREVVRVMRDRLHAHLDEGFPFAQGFMNRGAEAGASIAHPHAQMITIDVVPPAIDVVSRRFAADPDVLRRVIDDAARGDLIVADGPAVIWCPYASRGPFEMTVAVPGGGARFDTADNASVAAVADALGDALRRLQRVLGASVPYNVVFDSGPVGAPYQWFVRIAPRLHVTAGFEHTTDVYITTVRPEDAAEQLRTATITTT